jgi:hypothetical protein
MAAWMSCTVLIADEEISAARVVVASSSTARAQREAGAAGLMAPNSVVCA